jgi:hypothetical protein
MEDTLDTICGKVSDTPSLKLSQSVLAFVGANTPPEVMDFAASIAFAKKEGSACDLVLLTILAPITS